MKCLENEGVERIYGIPGEEKTSMSWMPCWTVISSSLPPGMNRALRLWRMCTDVLTGQAGVCLATLGPGATNLITGVADANMDLAPIIAIAGQGSTTRLHKEPPNSGPGEYV